MIWSKEQILKRIDIVLVNLKFICNTCRIIFLSNIEKTL